LWGKLRWMPQPNTTLVSWLQKKGRSGRRPRPLDVVFEGATPSKDTVIQKISEDAEL
jgi:hypothetical protein